MRCPRCNREGLHPYATCTHCGFTGPPGQVEELGHVAYLLGEVETWREVKPSAREQLRARYLRRREELELALGLRPPPLAAADVHKLQWEVFCLGELQGEAAHWLGWGWVRPEPAGRLRRSAAKRAETLQKRLADADAPSAPAFDSVRDRLKLLDYVEEMLSRARLRGHFVDDEAAAAALAALQADRWELEIEAGLRPHPPEPAPIGAIATEPAPSKELVLPPARPPKPREPLTWDRIWRTLLSERTLHVLLFLGAFLLMASATTYVVYNWERLPSAVQLAFIVLFTLSFYAAGWFLRVRMDLRASGIAVTAVGSLLVPLDFYAVLVAGEVLPAEQWAWAWLIASVVCLPIYTFTAVRIQAEFFGYTVAVAAGNLLCATLQVMGVPPEWWLAALSALALASAFVAYRLRTAQSAWAVLSDPLRFSALVATAVSLPLGIGWWLAGGAAGFDFNASLAGAWTLGAILYGYAAARERSPLLGRAAATALPVATVLLVRLACEPLGVETPWYALGWAILAPVYVWIGHRFHTRAVPPSPPGEGERDSTPVLRAHCHTATGWGLALMVVAAVWSVFDLWAAAATHAVVVAGAGLAVRLWERPRALPLASLLALSSITFAMAAGHLEPAELCLGWALLAVLHVLLALRLGSGPDYAARLYAGALAIAALALLPPLVFGHEALLTYVLGQWMALAAWLVWLDHSGEHPGLTALLNRFGPLRQSALHWAVALPLPFFGAMLYTRFRAPDAWLGLLLALLAWLCFAIGQLRRLTSSSPIFHPLSLILRHWSFPWYVVGYGCSLAGPVLASHVSDQPLLAVTVLLASALYFASAWAFRIRWWFVPAGLALPLGLLILLDSWAVSWPKQSVVLALAVAGYLLGGVGLERRRGEPTAFLSPLYAVAHLVALVALFWGLEPAMETHLPWPDPARLWAAGGQLILGVAYGLFAWFRGQERWGHVAAWLGVMAGGLVATAYSQGRGSSALKAALLAAAYVLAERLLASKFLRARWTGAERAWPLYRRALLIAGWIVSGGAISLALFRNLVFLGGGFIREAWAIVGLLTVTALYALSARLFRRRIFLWLAGVLLIAPWTLLTLWGWYLWNAPPPLPRYALSWAVLACLQFGLGVMLNHVPHSAGRIANPPDETDYGFPLRAIANGLLPLALFWAVADPATSSVTWGLGLAFYAVSAVADHRWGLTGWRAARFLYPAVAVMPVWAIYLLNHFWPAAPYEVYGLLLLVLALPLLGVGRWLQTMDPADASTPLTASALPLYLGAYGVAVVGTLLVAHQRPLFAAALTFDVALCVLSAWLFRESLWVYPAAVLAPAAMLVALAESQVPPERRGWWLIGLGTVYLALAWLLRRLRLRQYATPPLAAAFAVLALGLPPSSMDDVGAFYGYLAAALVYAVAAAWLRQPLLLAASAALLAVPYGVAVHWLGVSPADYGLAIFPGVVIALALAHLLDWRLGRAPALLTSWRPESWRLGALLDWWAAPWYAWGYIGAVVAVGLSLSTRSGQAWADSTRLALALGLAAVVYVHATWRFRSRAYLLLAGVLAQGAALAVIDAAGWLRHPAWAALAFLPVTVVTAGLAVAIETWRREGSPLGKADGQSALQGWSRPFYLLLAVDLLGGQIAALTHSEPGAIVTLVHALLLALLATVWVQRVMPFVAAGLGVVGVFQALYWAGVESSGTSLALALVALGYGLLGYGLQYALPERRRVAIWTRPLEWSAWGISAAALLWALVAGVDVVAVVVRTLLGHTVAFADFAPHVRAVMWVLAITGLLYLATAVVRRWYVVGYGAVALLLGAWALWWRFFMDMPGFQWYAVPAGLYLLGVGWLEWWQGRKGLARWVDRAGMLVWLGTAWWQSLPGVMPSGWPYALIMGAEALLLVWWGSARRLKQYLYVGVVGVVVSAVTQSIEPLLSANRWIVFGIVGLLLVGTAILVERKLETIRELSAELRERLEGWE
jgi:hypothetical protein